MNRNPWIAGLLGAVQPGLGHLYAGRSTPAILLIAAPLVVVPAAASAAANLPRPWNAAVLWIAMLGYFVVGVAGGARAARRAPRPFVGGPLSRWWACALAAGIGVFAIRPLAASWMQATLGKGYRIPSSAMEPTILAGDYLYVRADRTPPQVGEIVAFESIEEPGLLVLKRAVAVGGDTVEMRSGVLIRNGSEVAEPYARSLDPTIEADVASVGQMAAWQRPLLLDARPDYLPTLRTWGPLVLPAGTFLDLGDNRDGSYDGRFQGPVPVANVVGRPTMVYYSFDVFSTRPLPFMSAVRLARIGARPR